eukprot:1152459-Pelagomonas_calceolata.AAC.5
MQPCPRKGTGMSYELSKGKCGVGASKRRSRHAPRQELSCLRRLACLHDSCLQRLGSGHAYTLVKLSATTEQTPSCSRMMQNGKKAYTARSLPGCWYTQHYKVRRGRDCGQPQHR